MFILGFVVSSAPLFAQSQGRVIRDGIIWRIDAPSQPATNVKAGALLDVVARSSRWYEVVVGERLGGRGEHGLIAVGLLELVAGSPAPPFRDNNPALPAERSQPPPRPPAGPANRRPPQTRRRPQMPFKGYISVDGGYQMTSSVWRDSAVLRANAEDGHFDTSYSVKSGPGFHLGGGGYVWSRLGIGAEISRFSRSTPATLNGSVPHPFFFGQGRSVSADVGGLKREELAVHMQARWAVPLSPRAQLTVFGGPSVFRVKQDVVLDFTYTEAYPYDHATFGQAHATTGTKSHIGLNAGGDVAFFFTKQIGVGFGATFSRATIAMASASGGTTSATAGGMQAGGGLRLRF